MTGKPTEARIATVDAYVIRWREGRWEILLLQRAPDTRCPGAWEVVHGRLEHGERPEEGARREVREETALDIQRLYSIAVQPFYLPAASIVTLAVVFAAVVALESRVKLGPEHTSFDWLSLRAGSERVAWPRSRSALSDIEMLLRGGNAGAVEDVLRVP
ncbi:MAG: NUDIX domain-containing protein [Gemmatimonadaceae bacterium]